MARSFQARNKSEIHPGGFLRNTGDVASVGLRGILPSEAYAFLSHKESAVSVMPFLQFKIPLGMLADRTNLERFGAFVDVAAVPALPAHRFIFLEE